MDQNQPNQQIIANLEPAVTKGNDRKLYNRLRAKVAASPAQNHLNQNSPEGSSGNGLGHSLAISWALLGREFWFTSVGLRSDQQSLRELSRLKIGFQGALLSLKILDS